MRIFDKLKSLLKMPGTTIKQNYGCTRKKCLCKEQGISNIHILKTCNHYGKIN